MPSGNVDEAHTSNEEGLALVPLFAGTILGSVSLRWY